MKSAYAVVGQLAIAASNYAVFLIFAVVLDPDRFGAFTAAVGLNMFALAIAEGGISYVAPRELSNDEGRREGRTAGAYMTLSLVLYAVASVGGFGVWNALAPDGPHASWAFAYAAFALPSLLTPSWVTCWGLDVRGLIGIVVVRSIMVVAALTAPGPLSLLSAGALYGAFAGWLLTHLNRDQAVIAGPDAGALRAAVSRVGEVFLAKTSSYAMYGLAPMVIGISRGAMSSTEYVTGERLKALYATAFQPVIQTVYLAQFDASSTVWRRRRLQLAVHASNIVLMALVLAALHSGSFALLGTGFPGVEKLSYYIVAGACSVAAVAVLHFEVFPSGALAPFRFATAAQVVAFATMFIVIWRWADVGIAWVLLIAEASLLMALLVRLAAGRSVGSDR